MQGKWKSEYSAQNSSGRYLMMVSKNYNFLNRLIEERTILRLTQLLQCYSLCALTLIYLHTKTPETIIPQVPLKRFLFYRLVYQTKCIVKNCPSSTAESQKSEIFRFPISLYGATKSNEILCLFAVWIAKQTFNWTATLAVNRLQFVSIEIDPETAMSSSRWNISKWIYRFIYATPLPKYCTRDKGRKSKVNFNLSWDPTYFTRCIPKTDSVLVDLSCCNSLISNSILEETKSKIKQIFDKIEP